MKDGWDGISMEGNDVFIEGWSLIEGDGIGISGDGYAIDLNLILL